MKHTAVLATIAGSPAIGRTTLVQPSRHPANTTTPVTIDIAPATELTFSGHVDWY
jgi:hypothetical protein